MQYKFIVGTNASTIKENSLNYYLKVFNKIITKKKIPGAINILTKITVTYKIKKNFFLY
jgi:hypothetical protein